MKIDEFSLGNRSILASFSHFLWIFTFWKRLVEQAPGTYFQFDVFWIYMLWGIQNKKPKNFARTFGLTSLSA
jgi:hypothetical protein